MESRFIVPFMLRFLPSLIVLALGFYAATDRKARERWAQLLYQAGSLRPEQRDDPKVQGGVKVPFFVLALLMLFLPAKLGPLSYYFWATSKPETVMDLTKHKRVMDLDERAEGKDTGQPSATPTATPVSVSGFEGGAPVLQNPPPPPPGGAPGAPSSPAASGARSNPGGPGGLKSLRPGH